MPLLADVVANEVNVPLDQVMLLRHSITKTRLLARYEASIEEYTLSQPTGTRYDFFADGKPPVRIVVAIVEDQVYAVYHILGFQDVGTGDEWMPGNLRRFEHAGGGLRHCERRVYQAEEVKSRVVGRPIRCWAAPRHPVARFGEALFNSVEI